MISRGGGRCGNPKLNRQPIIQPNFPENCMKKKENWTGKGHV